MPTSPALWCAWTLTVLWCVTAAVRAQLPAAPAFEAASVKRPTFEGRGRPARVEEQRVAPHRVKHADAIDGLMSGGAPTTRPMVLIVDPRDDTRDLHGDWFVSVGFDVVCAADARTAFRIAKAVHPDLILTELRLRDSDGLQLVRQLQATAVTRHIPVLVVTSSTQAGVLEQATAAGATAAISALGSLDVLGAHVTALMARAASAAQPIRRRRDTPLSAILGSDDGNAGTES